jgi:hypothetical protein
MMEFIISKFWAFVVAMVIMGVLVQGVQMDARSDRDEALNDLAEELENLFDDFANSGPGLETTLNLCIVLPPTATLTMFVGHTLLEDGGREVRFTVPPFTMKIESGQGELREVDRLVLGPFDSLLLLNQAGGSIITALNR